MRRIIALIALTSALAVATTAGQAESTQPPLLTLEQALGLALAEATGNRQLEAGSARLAAAEAGIDEARSYRLPRVELQGGVERTDNPVVVFSNLLTQENFQAENFELDNLNRPDPLNDWSLRLSVEQPLWTGGRLAHREASARQHRDGAAAQLERTRQQVILQVTESYATAVLASHQVDVAREALETAVAHVRLISDLWQGGLVVESDLLLAQVRESEVREVLIRAESGVEVSRAALNLALGRDLSTPFNLPRTLELPADPELDVDALVERARGRRPDLRAVRHRTAATESRVDVARSGRRPQVAFRSAYETHAEDFFGADGDNWTLGVGVRVPLFEGFRTRSRVERSRAEAREAAELAELLSQSIALEVRRAYHELRAARQRLEQVAKAAELARRSLGIVEDRYKEGLATLPELLDAETALTEARLRGVASSRDVVLARARLDLATGDL